MTEASVAHNSISKQSPTHQQISPEPYMLEDSIEGKSETTNNYLTKKTHDEWYNQKQPDAHSSFNQLEGSLNCKANTISHHSPRKDVSKAAMQVIEGEENEDSSKNQKEANKYPTQSKSSLNLDLQQ